MPRELPSKFSNRASQETFQDNTSKLTLSLGDNTPEGGILVAGTDGVITTHYILKADGPEPLSTKKLKVLNAYKKTPGDLDNNISSVQIVYKNNWCDMC